MEALSSAHLTHCEVSDRSGAAVAGPVLCGVDTAVSTAVITIVIAERAMCDVGQ